MRFPSYAVLGLLLCTLAPLAEAQPSRLGDEPPPRLGTPDRSRTPPPRDQGPRSQRPESFTQSCEEQLRAVQQLVRVHKERIELLEIIRADLEKDNAKLKTTVATLEAQVEALKKQLSNKR